MQGTSPCHADADHRECAHRRLRFCNPRARTRVRAWCLREERNLLFLSALRSSARPFLTTLSPVIIRSTVVCSKASLTSRYTWTTRTVRRKAAGHELDVPRVAATSWTSWTAGRGTLIRDWLAPRGVIALVGAWDVECMSCACRSSTRSSHVGARTAHKRQLGLRPSTPSSPRRGTRSACRAPAAQSRLASAACCTATSCSGCVGAAGAPSPAQSSRSVPHAGPRVAARGLDVAACTEAHPIRPAALAS